MARTQNRFGEPALLDEKLADLPSARSADLGFSIMDEVGNISPVDAEEARNPGGAKAVFVDDFQKGYQSVSCDCREKSDTVPARLNGILRAI